MPQLCFFIRQAAAAASAQFIYNILMCPESLSCHTLDAFLQHALISIYSRYYKYNLAASNAAVAATGWCLKDSVLKYLRSVLYYDKKNDP